MPDLDKALRFAEDLAKESAEIARRHYDPAIAFDPKEDTSPVTQADLEINRLVIERCSAEYPNVGVLGEEESHSGTSNLLWVCDPIDGTIPYMLGARASTFCLALVDDGVPVVGVVYDFWNDRLYSAIKGKGAFVNGTSLSVPTGAPLKLCNLETFWAAPHVLDGLRQALFAERWTVLNYASSGFMGIAVAAGRSGGVVYTGNKAWDAAATKVVVEECGGKVTSLDGAEQRYDDTITGAIITGPMFGDELRKMAVEYYRKNLETSYANSGN